MMMCMTARNSSITPLDKGNQGVAINKGGKAQGNKKNRLSLNWQIIEILRMSR